VYSPVTGNVTLSTALVAPTRIIRRVRALSGLPAIGRARDTLETEVRAFERRQGAAAGMGGEAAEEVEVLAGSADGLRWAVFCSPDNETPGYLFTMLRVWSGDDLLVAGSGFGGAKLQPGGLFSEWRGRTDDLPFFVMARTSPLVERVVATTDRGLEVELALSEPVEQYGLRFAAAGLPEGHAPASIRAETADGSQTRPQGMRPRHRPPGLPEA
jgi:hypothetical protein